MTFKDKSSFPLKKCLIASVVIILCYLMVLLLLYGVVNSTGFEHGHIIFAVWGALLGASLLAYWAYQVYRHLKNRKDEKQGKRD